MKLRGVTILMLAAGPLALGHTDTPTLPCKGLGQHPFLYCGEWQRRSTSDQTMYIVRKGKVVWSYDLPSIPLQTMQEVTRLANGNTFINNWVGSVPQEDWPKVVQLIEVTPDKKVAWALRDWTTLGPASST